MDYNLASYCPFYEIKFTLSMIQTSLTSLGSRILLYEVVFPIPQGAVNPISPRRYSRTVLKVPGDRMSQTMERITRLGGKIISIKPLTLVSSLPWWAEVTTENPPCLYYFGPFDSSQEAAAHQDGYVEDLQKEGAINIKIELKQSQPLILTVEG